MDFEHHEERKLFSRFRYLAHLILLKGFILFVRITPYRAAAAAGRFFGLIVWACVPLHRRIAAVQIRFALGPENEKGISRRAFMNQGGLYVDMVKYAYMDDRSLSRKVTVEGGENFEAALASGRGIMIVTGHMNWEVLGHLPRLIGLEICVMADTIKNRAVQAVSEELRSRCRITVLPPRGGMVKRLTDELLEGRIIGMVIDQRGKRENRLFCDVFGMPAPTNPAPAFIALKGDALVLPVYAIRKDGRYTFRFERPLDARSFGDDFRTITKLCDSWKSEAVRSLS
ncbi:MAG TPA: lysophospholipid acyltransferase family protein, partial [Deltaproteobacteria bacterium]|nr:lysophospholipid acyltransferase family protein [Deltaproteobacteria bacterium]